MSNLDRERSEGLYLKFSEPLMEPHTPVIIERVNGNCTVSQFIIARDEAHELINQLCEFLRVGSPRKVGEDGASSIIVKRVFEMQQWVLKVAPHVFEQQKHLDEGSPERAYWHYGYLCALNDVLEKLASSVPVGEQKQEDGV